MNNQIWSTSYTYIYSGLLITWTIKNKASLSLWGCSRSLLFFLCKTMIDLYSTIPGQKVQYKIRNLNLTKKRNKSPEKNVWTQSTGNCDDNFLLKFCDNLFGFLSSLVWTRFFKKKYNLLYRFSNRDNGCPVELKTPSGISVKTSGQEKKVLKKWSSTRILQSIQLFYYIKRGAIFFK